MKSRFLRRSGLAVAGVASAVVLLGSVSPSAEAQIATVNINTSGTACRTLLGSDEDHMRYSAGNQAGNAPLGAIIDDTRGRTITCPVIRGPVGTGRDAVFYIDGKNPAGAGASCTLFVYDFRGNFRASASFAATTTVGSAYDKGLVVPGAMIQNADYVYLQCDLPAQGQLWGISASG